MREKIDIVKELINIAEENDLAELSIDYKGFKVNVKKENPQPATAFMPAMAAAPAAPQAAGTEAAEPAKAEKKPPVKGVPVKSPLTGVYYKSPKPGAPSFVNAGDNVEVGQTLCIIEAMKLMNEIAAEIKGKVVEIVKENGEVANENEVIMYIEPAG